MGMFSWCNFQNSWNGLNDRTGQENINYTIIKYEEMFYSRCTALTPANTCWFWKEWVVRANIHNERIMKLPWVGPFVESDNTRCKNYQDKTQSADKSNIPSIHRVTLWKKKRQKKKKKKKRRRRKYCCTIMHYAIQTNLRVRVIRPVFTFRSTAVFAKQTPY